MSQDLRARQQVFTDILATTREWQVRLTIPDRAGYADVRQRADVLRVDELLRRSGAPAAHRPLLRGVRRRACRKRRGGGICRGSQRWFLGEALRQGSCGDRPRDPRQSQRVPRDWRRAARLRRRDSSALRSTSGCRSSPSRRATTSKGAAVSSRNRWRV